MTVCGSSWFASTRQVHGGPVIIHTVIKFHNSYTHPLNSYQILSLTFYIYLYIHSYPKVTTASIFRFHTIKMINGSQFIAWNIIKQRRKLYQKPDFYVLEVGCWLKLGYFSVWILVVGVYELCPLRIVTRTRYPRYILHFCDVDANESPLSRRQHHTFE